MSYTDEQVSRMDAIMDETDDRLDAEKRTYTWRDIPALKELAGLYAAVPMADYDDIADYENAGAVTWYLGEAYAAMERYAPAAVYYTACSLAMTAEAFRFPDEAEIDPEEAEEVLATAIRARNYYEDDDCDDLVNAYRAVFGENCGTDGLFACRQTLAHDPAETTKEYLAVIDAVEEEMEKILPADATRAVRWAKKAELLAARGVTWRSPAVLNSDTHFQ